MTVASRPKLTKLTKSKLTEFRLDTEKAKAKAIFFKMSEGVSPEPDPCSRIKPSLLSADHIIEYVHQTGMIAPFEATGGDKSRLKAATYEGRIGEVAYIFEKENCAPQQILGEDDSVLTVPANSIVFVECDLDFRLPPFIAVRFNLQINHVHRGLLLGTGPLVDPGFWGKLCIPLHNLTNEPYEIERSDGLIWIEFTKTTSPPVSGRPPSNTGFWDIRKFIEKAAKPVDGSRPPIAIRSSIPDMVEEAEENSKDAACDARTAKNAAITAQESSQQTRNIGLIAGLAVFIGIATLWGTYYSDMNEQFDVVRPQIEELKSKLDDHVDRIEKFGQDGVEAATVIPDLKEELRAQKEQNAKLEEAMNKLQADVKTLKPCRKDPNRPHIGCLP